MGGWVERSDTHRSCKGPRWGSLRSTHPTELDTARLRSREQVEAFMQGTVAVGFSPPPESECYGWIGRRLEGPATKKLAERAVRMHGQSEFAEPIYALCREHFMPYLKFHRPCCFPATNIDANEAAPILVTFLCKKNQLDSAGGKCFPKSMLSCRIRRTSMTFCPLKLPIRNITKCRPFFPLRAT